MALNPFAKEYVPGVQSRVSSLSLSYGVTDGGAVAQPGEDAVSSTEALSHFRNSPRSTQMTSHQAFVAATGRRCSSSRLLPTGSPSVCGAPLIPRTSFPDDLEFEDVFGSPEQLAQLAQERDQHRGLHTVCPPNGYLGSPSLAGIESERQILASIDSSGYIHNDDDIQDIRDAISVPDAEIQDGEQDLVPRNAGIMEGSVDLDDVEAEAIGGSLFAQRTVFPDGLKQKEDEACSTSRKLTPQDFEMQNVIGQGAFGKVFLVTKRDSGEVFAMKVMRKDKILERDHGEYIKAEREVLTAVVHPYIVTLQYSFQTSSKIYLLLDFINGGHLFFQLFREGIFTEDLARLYTAEIVLAITHLHKCGFVHRDLKPENILLDSEGHVKVTDFGLAKKNVDDDTGRTNSYIGTVEYMAPEIITGSGHGKSVDWWSVGILLYEMLAGVPPFRAKTQAALKKQIISGKLKFPKYLSSQALNILKALLNRDVKKRLGYGQNGSEDVMKHQFFKSIHWGRLENRDVISPFRPQVASNRSVGTTCRMPSTLPTLCLTQSLVAYLADPDLALQRILIRYGQI